MNADGVVSREEMLRATMMSAQARRSMDEDRSGTLDREEVGTSLLDLAHLFSDSNPNVEIMFASLTYLSLQSLFRTSKCRL